MTEFTTPGEVFAEAADYIEEHGWMQGQYGEFSDGRYIPGCKVCLVGAVATALTGDPGEGRSFRRDAGINHLYELIRQQAHQDPLLWNDSPDRTQADVVRLLRALAARHG
jgi:hypothetical protein